VGAMLDDCIKAVQCSGASRGVPVHTLDKSADPLQWWLVSAATRPVLSLVSQCIMSVPVTSVPCCERLFSMAGVIISLSLPHVPVAGHRY